MSRSFSTAFRPDVSRPSSVSAAFSLGTVIVFTSVVDHVGPAAGGAAGAGSAAAGFFAGLQGHFRGSRYIRVALFY